MMETQQTLTERFDALQDALMTLYEEAPKDLLSQIRHWNLIRRENVILYYARREGLSRLGLQPIPALQVSEYKAKEAIHMQMLLKSLQKSSYANEEWSLTDTSAELVHTEPKNTFKKQGYQVEVWYDNDETKAILYPNWDIIYYEDDNGNWHKTKGEVDYDGLFFTEHNGNTTYFVIFHTDAQKYGQTGKWTVNFKNQMISAPVASSSRKHSSPSSEAEQPSTSRDTQTREESRVQHRQLSSTSSEASSTTPELRRGTTRRRGREQGERPTSTRKRRRSDSPGVSSAPTPEQVGSRHRLVEGSYHTRLGRLQAEARDPPIIIVQGSANNLKSWRRRFSARYYQHFSYCSTVWSWVGDVSHKKQRGRLLVAFRDLQQREHFLRYVRLPKHSTASYGSIDSL